MQAHRPLVLFLLLAMFAAPATVALAASDTPRAVKIKGHRDDKKKTVKTVSGHRTVSCGQFGPGFVRMAGSDTCLSLNGAIDAGISGGR